MSDNLQLMIEGFRKDVQLEICNSMANLVNQKGTDFLMDFEKESNLLDKEIAVKITGVLARLPQGTENEQFERVHRWLLQITAELRSEFRLSYSTIKKTRLLVV